LSSPATVQNSEGIYKLVHENNCENNYENNYETLHEIIYTVF
jgi:hypothetical protein